MPKNIRVTHKLKMPKILKLEIKKLQSKETYGCDLFGNSLVAISIVLWKPTARLEMNIESVRRWRWQRHKWRYRGIRFISFDVECVGASKWYGKAYSSFFKSKNKKEHMSYFYWVWGANETVSVKSFNEKWV